MTHHRQIKQVPFSVITKGAACIAQMAGFIPGEPYGPQTAIVDSDAVYALRKLVTGEIKSWEDIDAAELAVRAFVLHDKIEWLFPAILIATENHAFNFYPDPFQIDPINELLKHAKTSHRTVYNTQVFIDANCNLTTRKMNYQNGEFFFENVSNSTSKLWEKYSELFTGKNIPERQKIVLAAFSELLKEQDFLEAYVATPTMLGAASYFVNSNHKVFEENLIKNPHNNKWLSSVDSQWRSRLDILASTGLNIRLGPFLSIILTRASSRQNIPEEIIQLREEMQVPRTKLWDILNTLKYECDLKSALITAEKLEKAAQSIIPAAFPSKTNVIRFAWNAIKNGTLLGAIASFGDAILEKNTNWKQVSTIDAAQLLAKSLSDVDGFYKLTKRHLSDAELKSLGIF